MVARPVLAALDVCLGYGLSVTCGDIAPAQEADAANQDVAMTTDLATESQHGLSAPRTRGLTVRIVRCQPS